MKRVIKVCGPSGAPYLAMLSTLFVLVGAVICWCRPVVGSSSDGSSLKRRLPWSGGASPGATLAGDTCGQGGDLAILAGLLFLGIGAFLFYLGYRATHDQD